MSKLVITNIDYNGKNKIFCGLYNENKFYQVDFFNEESDTPAQIGDIFVGRIKDIAKNISAAFIEYKKGCTGYFSLEENSNIIFLNKKNTDKLCVGDDIIVQIQKAAVKTKFPVLTSNISISGRNIVLNIGKNGVGFSGKIKNPNFKNSVNSFLSERIVNYERINSERYGVIVRTNAENASEQELLIELENLINEWILLKTTALTRKSYSILKKTESKYLKTIKSAYKDEIREIITDNKCIYNEVNSYLKQYNINLVEGLRLYEDSLLPLYKLYSIENLIDNILSKKVWLKSGAYLVIESTEAMVVIDVNTGKCIKGKKPEETIFKVNTEAAEEIAHQIRLRNLSGMIMIDFINMTQKEKQNSLLNYLDKIVLRDRIKTTVVDITKLNIVEITRMKKEPPVYEQLKL